MDPKAKKILDDLKKKKYQPVYFLQGEEPYFIDLISDYIETRVLDEAERGFNQMVLYGKDVTMATVLTNARRYPMMAERQVVIVKEAQDIQDLNRDSGSKLLQDYLAQPSPTTVLVFCHKHKNLDKRKKLGSQIDSLAEVLTTKKLYDNQLPDFISELAAERGVSMEDKAVVALAEFVGNDLNRLVNEFEKLLVVTPKGQAITLDTVISQVGISKEYNIFELQRAIVQKDVVQANKIVNYFEANTRKNPVIPIVAFMFSFFSKLLAASQVGERNDKSIASELKVSPYAARDYTLALRHYPVAKIAANVSLLQRADLRLKGVNSGSESDGQLLRELVFRLMH